jgi:RHS repeat-associated protein
LELCNKAVTVYKYDGAGRQVSIAKGDKVITYAYDTLERVISETEGGITHAKEYDLLDRVIEERIEHSEKIVTKKQFKYDWDGNRTHEIIFTKAGVATQVTNYNPHGEILSVRDALGHVSHYTYDSIEHSGQKVNRAIYTDPLGNQEIKIYDTNLRISEVERRNPFGKVIQSEKSIYDASGNKCQSIAKVFNQDIYSRTIVTEWEYDCMGNMIHCIEAKGTLEQKNTRLIYNLNGEKEQIVRPNGTRLYHTYDLFGRLERFKSSDASIDYTYSYDLKDNLIQVEDHIHGTSTKRSYDKYNRLLSEILDTGLTLGFSYDLLDRPLTITLPDLSAIHYNYEGHYLSRIDRIKGNQIVYSHHYTEFDQAENPLKMLLPGQAGQITFKYDLLQRPIEINAPHWQETIPKKGYDAAGNLLARQVIDAQGSIDYNYTYDDLYQLSSEKGHATNTYANDSICNRIAKNEQPYLVNDLNQLLHESNQAYAYDVNGNLVSIKREESQTTFVYDALDRLIQVKKDDTVINYAYDSFHRRLTKMHNGITTNYLYLKDNEIGSMINQKTKELRILGLGKGAEIGAAIAIELDETPYVPIHDPYGNVTTLLNLKGEVVTNYRYTAFGEEQINGSSTNAWRYSSKRVDPETGFIYFGRRYYFPSIGRWLTPDPLWFADGPNLYAYVHNRPMTSIDPDGQFAFLIPIALSLALDYCMPTIMAGLAEYAVGGSVAASVLSGFASGYCDPLSSAFDSETYSLGDADVASFLCNRAGMLLGAAVACRPTNAAKTGVKSVANIASKEIAGAVITKAELAITKTVTTSLKQGSKNAAQKTALVAEQYIVKKNAGSDWAHLSGTLRQASKEKGNFGIGSATREQANAMGLAWVGESYTVSRNGTAWVSKDKMKQFRPPSLKSKLGKMQANFQRRFEGQLSNDWQANGHLDIFDILE